MRWIALTLAVLLVGTVAVGGVLLVKQRASILASIDKVLSLESAVAERDARIAAGGAKIDQQAKEIAKVDAAREEKDKALAAQANAQQKAVTDQQRALSELAELQKDRDAAKARLDQLQRFIQQFKKLIDAGKLQVEVRRGRLVLVMPNDVLFDEAKVAIKPDAQTALREIAATLKTVKDRQFQIVGHTDATPIKSTEFPSNWELSSARSLAVVKLLIDAGVPGSMLAATARGEYEPRDSNLYPYGRARNRRIENRPRAARGGPGEALAAQNVGGKVQRRERSSRSFSPAHGAEKPPLRETKC